jgi:hypothetical protein
MTPDCPWNLDFSLIGLGRHGQVDPSLHLLWDALAKLLTEPDENVFFPQKIFAIMPQQSCRPAIA